jgi:hypothetical protein
MDDDVDRPTDRGIALDQVLGDIPIISRMSNAAERLYWWKTNINAIYVHHLCRQTDEVIIILIAYAVITMLITLAAVNKWSSYPRRGTLPRDMRCDHAIAQHADPLHFQLDHIARC